MDPQAGENEPAYPDFADAQELYAAILGGTTEQAVEKLRDLPGLESALGRPRNYALYEEADLALQAAALAWDRREPDVHRRQQASRPRRNAHFPGAQTVAPALDIPSAASANGVTWAANPWGSLVWGTCPVSSTTNCAPGMVAAARRPTRSGMTGSWRPQITSVGAVIVCACSRRSCSGEPNERHRWLTACSPGSSRVVAMPVSRARSSAWLGSSATPASTR